MPVMVIERSSPVSCCAHGFVGSRYARVDQIPSHILREALERGCLASKTARESVQTYTQLALDQRASRNGARYQSRAEQSIRRNSVLAFYTGIDRRDSQLNCCRLKALVSISAPRLGPWRDMAAQNMLHQKMLHPSGGRSFMRTAPSG